VAFGERDTNVSETILFSLKMVPLKIKIYIILSSLFADHSQDIKLGKYANYLS
jgi:hypothetical protein